MTLEVWRDSQQAAGFLICVLTLPICVIATALRFVATVKANRTIGLENWFALAALVFFVVYTSMFLYLLTILNGRGLLEFQMTAPQEIVHLLKVGWGMSPQFCGNQLFTKLSLLFLYYRLFGVNKTFRRWLFGLSIVQIGWFISVYIVKWMLCFPVRYTWDKTVPGGACIAIGPFLAASETINSVVDFAMIGLAVWIVHSLRMSKMTKWKLSILFSLGGLSGVIGFIKIGEAYTAAYTNILDPIWDIVQMATSIICCCAPIYRSLFVDTHLIKSMRSLFSDLSLPKSWRSTHGGSSHGSGDSKDQSYLPLEGISNKDKTRTHVSAAPYSGSHSSESRKSRNSRDERRHHRPIESPYLMRTLEVRQDVEYV